MHGPAARIGDVVLTSRKAGGGMGGMGGWTRRKTDAGRQSGAEPATVRGHGFRLPGRPFGGGMGGMGAGRLRPRGPADARSPIPYNSGRNCRRFISPVFSPGTCYRAAQVSARPAIKTTSQDARQSTGRGRSIPKHVGEDRSPNAGLAALAKLSSAVHVFSVGRWRFQPRRSSAGMSRAP
jgi:hypothetical protein